MLDQIDYGLIMVDAADEIRYANQAAHEAKAVDHPLEIRNHRLSARRRDDAESLDKALRAITRGLRSLLVLARTRTACVAGVPLQGSDTGKGHETLVVLGKRSVCAWVIRSDSLARPAL